MHATSKSVPMGSQLRLRFIARPEKDPDMYAICGRDAFENASSAGRGTSRGPSTRIVDVEAWGAREFLRLLTHQMPTRRELVRSSPSLEQHNVPVLETFKVTIPGLRLRRQAADRGDHAHLASSWRRLAGQEGGGLPANYQPVLIPSSTTVPAGKPLAAVLPRLGQGREQRQILVAAAAPTFLRRRRRIASRVCIPASAAIRSGYEISTRSPPRRA